MLVTNINSSVAIILLRVIMIILNMGGTKGIRILQVIK